MTPAANQTGTATITLTVSDGAYRQRYVRVDGHRWIAPGYPLSESFEGAGFENAGWSLSGTPNPNYTTTTLEGLESLNTVGTQTVSRAFAYSTTFSMYFQARWNTWSDFTSIVHWDDANWGEGRGHLGRRQPVVHQSRETASVRDHAPQPEHDLPRVGRVDKGHWNQRDDDVVCVHHGTKPAAADATITTGKGGATQSMYIGGSAAGPNVIFDLIQGRRNAYRQQPVIPGKRPPMS